MISIEEVTINGKFEDEILDLIENKDNYTQSDLQARTSAIVLDIIRAGKELSKKRIDTAA